MNPYPYDMRHGKTHVTLKRLVDNHDHALALAAILKARLDEFTERFLLMTFNAQPRTIRRVSKILSVSFDLPYLQSPTVKAYTPKTLNARAAKEARTAGPDDVPAAPRTLDDAVALPTVLTGLLVADVAALMAAQSPRLTLAEKQFFTQQAQRMAGEFANISLNLLESPTGDSVHYMG